MERLGRYEILGELGRGAMGRVYKARDPRIDRLVAVKLMAPDEELPPAQVEEWRARFQREARAAGRLAHPHIVAIHDVGEEDGRPFLVMEFVEGESLESILRDRRTLPLDLAARLLGQTADALEYAHGRGIVHRDIKPANILITGGNTAKVSDFGIARLAEGDITRTGTILGSPGYMSPEQIAGLKLDGRSDIFALGAVLYEAVSGEKAFPGESISAIAYRIVHEDPTPLKRLNPAFPVALDACLKKALAKDPARRYARAADLARDLRAALEAPAPVAELAPTVADAAPPRRPQPRRHLPPPRALEAPPRRRGAGWVWGGAAAVLILGLAFGVAQRVRRPTPVTRPAPMAMAPAPAPSTGAAPAPQAAAPDPEPQRRAEAERLEAERRRLEEAQARLAKEQAALEQERQRVKGEAGKATKEKRQEVPPPQSASPPSTHAPAAPVRFSGNTAISTEELTRVLAEELRQPAGPETLGKAARRITEHYHSRGYVLARAIPQRPDQPGGTPEIKVFEGRIGQLKTAGLGRQEQRVVEAAFAPVLRQGLFEKQAVGEAVKMLAERRGLPVKLRIVAGKVPGTADLVIERSLSGQVEVELGAARGARFPLKRESP
ncbi:MAG: protein kinase [candidate division NC10 bacterium]|nr:protein kinase [candidate division NC10 bacterium]